MQPRIYARSASMASFGLLVGSFLLLVSPGTATASTAAPRVVAPSDFDGDGFADLAIGVPGDFIGGAARAGAVTVLYGSAVGLSTDGTQLWSQDSPGIPDRAEVDDAFGGPLAAGDYDGDGFSDLAIPAAGEDLGDVSALNAGAVHVLYGGPAGLSADGTQFWTQDSPGVLDQAEDNDLFGTGALAAGDLNGDGIDDLAIGVASEDVNGAVGAGAVNVLYGSAQGLTARGDQFWHQDSPGVLDEAEGEAGFIADDFGRYVEAGDFDGDGFDDLAVGVPTETLDGIDHTGAVNVIYGSAAGLTSEGNQLWSQASRGVQDEPLMGELFGSGLAAGDFDNDGFAELAVGVPTNVIGGPTGVIGGSVNVLRGSASGLTSRGSQLWHQDRMGVLEEADEDDWFGQKLWSADFDGDGFADLAVGAQNDYVSDRRWAGAVNVLYGSPDGLSAKGDQVWSQDTAGVPDEAESEDFFGIELSAADYDGDGNADLAIGVSFENLTFFDQGAIHVVYGSAGGLTVEGTQFWHQDSPGVPGEGFSNDRFGASLS